MIPLVAFFTFDPCFTVAVISIFSTIFCTCIFLYFIFTFRAVAGTSTLLLFCLFFSFSSSSLKNLSDVTHLVVVIRLDCFGEDSAGLRSSLIAFTAGLVVYSFAMNVHLKWNCYHCRQDDVAGLHLDSVANTASTKSTCGVCGCDSFFPS